MSEREEERLGEAENLVGLPCYHAWQQQEGEKKNKKKRKVKRLKDGLAVDLLFCGIT